MAPTQKAFFGEILLLKLIEDKYEVEECKEEKFTKSKNNNKLARFNCYPFHVICLLNLAQTPMPCSSLEWPGFINGSDFCYWDHAKH